MLAFRFGIDCVDRLEWKGWRPGGEYDCILHIRNVSTKTIKFKYKLPSSKYFSMEFPETIKLVAGMSFPAKITFRPVKMEPYLDFVQICVSGATFNVAICAVIPAVRLEMPSQIDFGFSAVKEVSTSEVFFKNI